MHLPLVVSAKRKLLANKDRKKLTIKVKKKNGKKREGIKSKQKHIRILCRNPKTQKTLGIKNLLGTNRCKQNAITWGLVLAFYQLTPLSLSQCTDLTNHPFIFTQQEKARRIQSGGTKLLSFSIAKDEYIFH